MQKNIYKTYLVFLIYTASKNWLWAAALIMPSHLRNIRLIEQDSPWDCRAKRQFVASDCEDCRAKRQSVASVRVGCRFSPCGLSLQSVWTVASVRVDCRFSPCGLSLQSVWTVEQSEWKLKLKKNANSWSWNKLQIVNYEHRPRVRQPVNMQ